MNRPGRYHAAAAASLLSHCPGEYRDPGRPYPVVAVRPGTPVPPVASPPANIYKPVLASQVAQRRHRQNNAVCDTIFLIITAYYISMAQWHRQKTTYHTCVRARACVNRFLLFNSIFDYLKNCLCHCATPIKTRLRVCANRV
jgi:hypothetical protein